MASAPPTLRTCCSIPTRRFGRLGDGIPQMVAVVRNAGGARVGVQLTYLSEDSAGRVAKAEVNPPRKSRGSVGGCAVWLGTADAGGWLALAEGIETGLSVMAAKPELSVWACLGTAGLRKVIVPPAFLPDRDFGRQRHSGEGCHAAEAAAARLRDEGCEVMIATPPCVGDDFNDLLLRDGLTPSPPSSTRLCLRQPQAGRAAR